MPFPNPQIPAIIADMSLALSWQVMDARLDRLLYGLAWVLALVLPFEIIRPVWHLAGLAFTNLELLLAVTAVFWLLCLWRDAAARARVKPLLGPIVAFGAVMVVAAVAAPFYRVEALKFAARLVSGCYLLLLVAVVVTRPKRLVGLMWAVSLGAAATALLGLAEWVGWNRLDLLWPLFKVSPSRIGGELRLSATFQYATIAAFYLEMAIPLMLALAAGSSRRSGRWLATAMVVVATAAVILTLTRSGILFLALLYLGLLLLAWRSWRFRALVRPTAVALLSLVLTLAFLLSGSGQFRTRLLTENDLNWYNARYQAPLSLNLSAGQSGQITVQVFNSGHARWLNSGDQAFALGYRWLDASGEPLATSGHIEIELPHDVPPDEWVSLTATITAPAQAGNYAISWGMLQRHILWFHHRGVPDALTQVQVGAPARPEERAEAAPLTWLPDMPPMPVTVARRDLWRAAGQMIMERPLLGYGPDNFRRLYGRYLDLPEADERIHANNLYLELLATTGVAGSLALAWLLWFCLRPLARNLLSARRGAPASGRAPLPGFATPIGAVALAGSLAAFFAHGLVDYFLGFTPTASLFWFVLGLAWVATAGHNSCKVTNVIFHA
jgi:hypothetical protein